MPTNGQRTWMWACPQNNIFFLLKASLRFAISYIFSLEKTVKIFNSKERFPNPTFNCFQINIFHTKYPRSMLTVIKCSSSSSPFFTWSASAQSSPIPFCMASSTLHSSRFVFYFLHKIFLDIISLLRKFETFEIS